MKKFELISLILGNLKKLILLENYWLFYLFLVIATDYYITLSDNTPDSQATSRTSTAVFHFVFSMQGNGIVRLKNGRTGFVRWNPHHPIHESIRTKMGIQVNFKPGGRDSGMFNVWPTHFDKSVPLCEITLA